MLKMSRSKITSFPSSFLCCKVFLSDLSSSLLILLALLLYRYGIHKASHCARFIGLTALAMASITVWLAGRLPDGL